MLLFWDNNSWSKRQVFGDGFWRCSYSLLCIYPVNSFMSCSCHGLYALLGLHDRQTHKRTTRVTLALKRFLFTNVCFSVQKLREEISVGLDGFPSTASTVWCLSHVQAFLVSLGIMDPFPGECSEQHSWYRMGSALLPTKFS